MRKSLTFVAVLAVALLGLVGCQNEPVQEPTAPAAAPIEITLSSPSVAVNQELHIIAHGGNGDYRVSLVVYNYGGYDSLDMSTCLGYLSQKYNGATFLFRPQETCSSRPDAVSVYVRDTDWNHNAVPLVLEY